MDRQALKTGITGVATVAIPVTDQERALAFYVDTLGFEKRLDAPFGPGNRWIEVAPPGSSTTIALPTLGDIAPGIDTGIRLMTRNAEADHAALQARGADVDHAALQARGADVDAGVLIYPGVPPMFVLRDPDGNTLYVVEAMARPEAG